MKTNIFFCYEIVKVKRIKQQRKDHVITLTHKKITIKNIILIKTKTKTKTAKKCNYAIKQQK